MKKSRTRISCMLAIFLSLVLLLASFVTPMTAADAGSDPIFTDGKYGIKYENGMYTLSIDAARLVEILKSRDFNKETLLEIMPPEVYELLTSRDPEAAINLYNTLLNETSLGELKEDLPLDILVDFLDNSDITELIDIDKAFELVDIQGIIENLTDEEFFALFKDGALEALLEEIDLEALLDEETRLALLESLTAEELFGALKEDAIKHILLSESFIPENIFSSELIEALIADGFITEEDVDKLLTHEVIDAVLHDDYLIGLLYNSEEVMEQILSSEQILSDLFEIEEFTDLLISKHIITDAIASHPGLIGFIFEDGNEDLFNAIFDEDFKKALFEDKELIEELIQYLDDSGALVSLVKYEDIIKSGLITTAEMFEILDKYSSTPITPKILFDKGYITEAEAIDIISDYTSGRLTPETLYEDGYITVDEAIEIIKKYSGGTITPELLYNDGYITLDEAVKIINSVITPIMLYNDGFISVEEVVEIAEHYAADHITLDKLKDGNYITDDELLDIAARYPGEAITLELLINGGYISVEDLFTIAETELGTEISVIDLYDDNFIEATKVEAVFNEYVSSTTITPEELYNGGYLEEEDVFAIVNKYVRANVTPENLYNDGIITIDDIIEMITRYSDEDVTLESLMNGGCITNDDIVDIALEYLGSITLSALENDGYVTYEEVAEEVVNGNLIHRDDINYEDLDIGWIATHIDFDFAHLKENIEAFTGVPLAHTMHERGMLDDFSLVENADIDPSEIADILKHHPELVADIEDAVDHNLLFRAIDVHYVLEQQIVKIPDIIAIIDDARLLEIYDYYKGSYFAPEKLLGAVSDINVILNEIEISKLPIKKILGIIDFAELVKILVKDHPVQLAKSLKIKEITELDAVKDALKDISFDDLKDVIDIEKIKTEIVPDLIELITNNVADFQINGITVFSAFTGKINAQRVRDAIYDAIPTVEEVMNLGNDGEIASLTIDFAIKDPDAGITVAPTYYAFGFRVVLVDPDTENYSSIAEIKRYAEKISEYVTYSFESDGTINLDIKATDGMTELYLRAINSEKLPDRLRQKLQSLNIYEISTTDIKDLVNKIVNNLSYDEMVELLASVDVNLYTDNLLNKVGVNASQAESIRNIIIKAHAAAQKALDNEAIAGWYQKIFGAFTGGAGLSGSLERNADSAITSRLTNYYTGEGEFFLEKGLSFDLNTILPASIEPYFTNTDLSTKVKLNLEVEGIRQLKFISNGNVVYSTLVTADTSIDTIIASNSTLTALGGTWAYYEGSSNIPTVCTTIAADADLSLAQVRTATFRIKNLDGAATEYTEIGTPVQFTELFRGSLPLPSLSAYAIEGYTLAWADHFTPGTNEDIVLTAKYTQVTPPEPETKYTLIYTPGDTRIEIEFTLDDTSAIANLLAPVSTRDHYNATGWKIDATTDYSVENLITWLNAHPTVRTVTLEKAYTPIEYTINYGSNSKKFTIENYMSVSIAKPAATPYYISCWLFEDEEYNIEDVLDWFAAHRGTTSVTLTADPDHTPITYTVKFEGINKEYSFTILTKDAVAATFPTPSVITHYANAKWQVSIGGTYVDFDFATQFANTALFDPTKATTVTAKRVDCDPIKYTLTTEYEDPNGVTQKKDYEFTIESYDNIKNIALPSYPHYTYSAWKFNGNVSLSSTALFNWFEANPGQTKVTATSNRTINKYTLGFVDNEGRIAANSITDITILNYKEKLATLPTPPNKKHYTPASQWTLNGAPYEIEALMTAFLSNSNQTLVMDYTPVTYTLTFIDFKGNVVGEPIEFDITSDLDTLISRFPTVPSVPNEDPYIYKYAAGTEYWDIAKEDIFSDEYYNENRTLSREVKVNATLIVYDKIVVNGTEHPVEEGFTYDDIEKIVENVISETDSEYDSNWFKLITEFSVDENGVITATSRKDALSFNIVFKDENGNVIPETTITFTYYERMDPITYPDYKRAGYDVTWNWNPAYNSVTGLAPTNYEVSAVLTPSTTPPQTDPIETPPVVTPPESTPEQTPPASTPEGTTTDPGQVEPAPEKNMNWLWWTLLAILILAIVGCVLYIILFAKKNDDDDDDTPEPEPEPEPEPMPEPKPEPVQHHAFIPILEDVAADEVDDILTDEDALSEIIESDEVGGTGKKMYVNIGRICLEYEAGETVDIESLKERKLLSPKAGRVKILADGHLDKALTVKADDFSAQAVKMILLTGGTVIHLK